MVPRSTFQAASGLWAWALCVGAAVLAWGGGCTRGSCAQDCDGAEVCVDGACRTPCNVEDDCPRRSTCDNGMCVPLVDMASTSSSSGGSTASSGSTSSTPSSQTLVSSRGVSTSSAAGTASSQAVSQGGSSAAGGSSNASSSQASSAGSSSANGSSAASLVPVSSSAVASSSLAVADTSSSQASSQGPASASGSSSGAGVSSSCAPESAAQYCSRFNASCGVVAGVDNCGTSRNQVCGVCPMDDLCTAQHQCCTPETDQQLCNAAGAQCGSITVVDACVQTRTVDCGACNGGRRCQSNMCAPLGWVFVGVGNSTYAGTNNGVTIGTVPSTAQHIAIAVWAAEDENRTVSGNEGNYTITFDGVTTCTRSVAPWTATTPEGGCFIQPADMSFHFDGNYPVGSITECALDYSANNNVVSFEDQSATEDCGFAIYAYVP